MVNMVQGSQIAALLAPMAVTLVTACAADGDDCVATIAWAMPISHEPSMLAVSIRPAGRTARAIREGGCFVVNVLPAGEWAVHAATVCGAKHGVADRFAQTGIRRMPAVQVAAVCVEQACSWIECEFVERREYGDHALFIGKTLAARTRGRVSSDGTVAPAPVLLMGQRSHFGHFEED